MQLQGRELGMMTTGDDVKLLQQELRGLGYSIPDTESQQGFFGQNTQAAVMDFQKKHSLQPTGRVDQPTATLINRDVDALSLNFAVHGLVRHPDGRPVTGVSMAAFDKDLRDEQRLGEVATTDAEGRYEIKYTAAQFSRAEKKSADLIVRVYKDQELSPEPLAESPIIFNAQPVETVDLVFGNQPFRGPAEFDQLLADIAPVLAVYQLQPAQLTDADIKFLSSDTGQPVERLTFLVTAYRLQDQTKLPAEVYYGFFRKKLPTELRSLLAQSEEVLRLALESAINENIISTRFADQLQPLTTPVTDRVIALMKQLTVAQAFNPPDPNGPSLSSLLSLSISQDKHAEFLSIFVNHKGPVEEFWKALRDNPDFKDKVSDIQFTLQLHTLTDGHLPLVQQIKSMQERSEIASLKDLARFDVADWKSIVSREDVGLPADVPGIDADEKATNYAKAMTRLIEGAFPTAFVANRIAQDDVPGKTDLTRFFENNPEFDLTAIRFDTYVGKNPKALDGVTNSKLLGSNIKAMQRVYKLAPRYAQTSVLMKDGHHSAFSISRVGQAVFVNNYSSRLGGAAEARMVYERAEQTAAVALNLLAQFGMGASKISLAVAPDIPVASLESGRIVTREPAAPDGPVEALESTGDWATLFGSLDLCECEHCRSVYGPAAYFVDALHFLRDRKLIDTITRDADGRIIGRVTYRQITVDGVTRDKSAKDALFERRADLGEIELTCENTNTPVPYIDLVNEALENAVAAFDLAAGLASDLDARTFSDDLRTAFGPNVSAHAVITVRRRGDWWTIDDSGFTYNIRKEGANLHVVLRSLQTLGTAQERAANPQHVNTHAYTKLRGQAYPWSLPFDLWMEEARAYLRHLGVQRHEVMETFLPGDRAAMLASDEVAREHLGLTTHEARLITAPVTGESAPPVWNLWGFAGASLGGANQIPDPADSTRWISSGNWLNVIRGRVDVFLQQSGLSYKEMLELLGTDYLNRPVAGGRPIQIQSTDPHEQDTCVTAKLQLLGLDEEAAVKISRFVRLQRKLGWTARDLDKAITSLHLVDTSLRPVDTAAGRKEFLRRLSHVKRLQAALNLPLDSLLAFYSTIDAANYVDYQAANQPTVESLYARLFRNRTIINPLDPAFPEDPLNSAFTGTLTEHIPTITAALGISAADFDLLLHNAEVIPQVPDPADAARAIPDDRLRLDYLSLLYRHATLAKALRLKTSDYLSALNLLGDDPFAFADRTVLWFERLDKVRESGFSIAELDYLLRHKINTLTDTAPKDEEIALALSEIRGELQKIAAENTFRDNPADPAGATSDPDGEMVKKRLALLNWDDEVVDRIIAVFNGSAVFEAPLGALPATVTLPNDTGSYEVSLMALPPGFELPEQLVGVVRHDATVRKLRASRRLTPPERQALLTASTEPDYQTAVNDLVRVQDELVGEVSYDPDRNILRFVGPMTTLRRDRLNEASTTGDTDYRNAVDALFDAPRSFISRNLRTFTVPNFSAPQRPPLLDALPASVEFPVALRNQVYFDAADKQLHFIGAMTVAEQRTLLALSTNEHDTHHAAYQAAVNALFAMPGAEVSDPMEPFLTAADVALLFPVAVDARGDDWTPESRFNFILKKLMNYLLPALSRRAVAQRLGEALKLESKAADELLTKRLHLPTPTDPLIAIFQAPFFAQSNPHEKLVRAVFADQFNAYTLLHKTALIVSKFGITSKQLDWLFANRDELDDPAGTWLDFNTLPVQADAPPAPLLSFERLIDLFRLRAQLPDGESLLTDIFDLARAPGKTVDDLLKELSKQTQWGLTDLQFLARPEAFNLASVNEFKDEKKLVRLRACFAMLRRLGMTAELCRRLSGATGPESPEQEKAREETVARSVRQAVRAKYDEAEWTAIAKPLQDVLRERQRQALVAYLVTHPAVPIADGATQPPWRDVNGLYAHYLIDVEMSPCQMTSRIKQAISSVQLFVQRCLMKLERDVLASAEVDDGWRQWKWMKNYRAWEANRKVFLYPENWIEPELRDDKSPSFKELESELLQSDLTLETAETAFVHYLEKLDAVANLEIVGMYHQVEETVRGHTAVDVLHVFGRTRGTPHIYYYRRRVDSAYWTAWEKVDVDIEGDHLIPVVWNRRLHLFWPIFTEETEETDGSVQLQTDTPIPPPAKRWRFQLAWSERTNQWTPKRISSLHWPFKIDTATFQELSHAKEDYFFRSWVDVQTDKLYILIFSQPVHSDLTYTFQFDGSHHDPVPNFAGRFVVVPARTRVERMLFVETGVDGLLLPVPFETIALNKTPGTFRLLPPHEGSRLDAHPFFYSDNTRTFFVTPERVPQVFSLPARDTVSPAASGFRPDYYYPPPPISAIPNPIDPIASPLDPALFDSSFPRGSRVTPVSSHAVGGSSPAASFGGEMTVGGDGMPALPSDGGLASAGFASGSDAGTFTTSGVVSTLIPVQIVETRYRFQTFYHPYVCRFVRELNRDGIDGLLQRPVQMVAQSFFEHDYGPTGIIVKGDLIRRGDVFEKEFYPREDVDFSYGGGYAQYNWELFFHAPLLIADRLSKNQRFEDAQRWFHYIFDPTDTSSLDAPQRYWRTKPFYLTTSNHYHLENIPNLLRYLANPRDAERLASLTSEERRYVAELPNQVKEWRQNPFRPHLIARLRTTAYQKTVVMKYIDNLIAWGDQLFRRDTIESINEATQLYILAADMLGRRPAEIPPRAVPEVQTFNTIEPKLDAFSNALVGIEEFVPPSSSSATAPTDTGRATMTLPTVIYFCVPKNDKLLGYWDTVADRLFKIRHCMNIEGIERQLPLFEPPIDPALLVKAAAAGVDISSALNDISAPLPHYRFNVMAQKASELCAEVKALGGALLSALEKRDAEALSLLRSTHEINLLNAVRQMKEKQIDETKQNIEALKKSRDLALSRKDFYSSRDFMNFWEVTHLELAGTSLALKAIEALTHTTAGSLHLIPNFKIGSPFSVGATYGGENTGKAAKSFGNSLATFAALLGESASMAATMGGHQRRMDDWKLQERLAAKEIEQIDKQIVAAEIRFAIAELELKNHDLQIENAKTVDKFMRDKFTNRELYDWMVGQTSAIYFQSYQLAYDVAKRAERACRHELGLTDSSFIQFGYWDSLKKGLLAGERLYHDIKRLEVAYLDQNKRELELTRHVSLRQLNPLALLTLKTTGTCQITVPEWLFDRDCPGHYMRRIKNVALSIPSVVGPYTSVNCTLSLLRSTLRKSPVGDYARQGSEDSRFADYIGAVQSIVTSSGNNDSGLFETNLRDERFLPFEGAGAESTWKLDLPADYRAFDYATISDVILHIRYTARQGVDPTKVNASLGTLFQEASQSNLALLFSLRHDFPTEWSAFVNGADPEQFTATIRKDYFPYFAQGRTITITGLELYGPDGTNPPPHRILPDPDPATPFPLGADNQAFTINAERSELTREASAQVFLIIRYKFS